MKVLLLTGKIPCKYDQKFNSSLVPWLVTGVR